MSRKIIPSIPNDKQLNLFSEPDAFDLRFPGTARLLYVTYRHNFPHVRQALLERIEAAAAGGEFDSAVERGNG